MCTLPIHFNIFSGQQALLQAAAEHWILAAQNAINDHGQFSVALTGGSTPRPLYQLLAEEKYASRLDWSRVYLFWGDERMVPVDHKDSNYNMAKETLIDHIPIPAKNIFPMVSGNDFSELDLDSYVQHYDNVMKQFVGCEVNGFPKFDLIMLGMGADGHTASLFPATDILDEKNKAVAKVYVEKLRSWRISLTYPVLEVCENILLTVCGKDKADVLNQVFSHPQSNNQFPISRIALNHSIHWYLDKDAVAELETNLG